VNLLQKLSGSLDFGLGVPRRPPENRQDDVGQFFEQGPVHLPQQGHERSAQDQIVEVDNPLVERREFDLAARIAGVIGQRRILARL
jgi:hypothetical protein